MSFPGQNDPVGRRTALILSPLHPPGTHGIAIFASQALKCRSKRLQLQKQQPRALEKLPGLRLCAL